MEFRTQTYEFYSNGVSFTHGYSHLLKALLGTLVCNWI